MKDQRLSLYLLVAAETVHSYSQFMPDLEAVADHPEHDHRKSVRRGELYGGTWTFIVTILIAHATNSPTPFAIWLLASAAMVGIYEYHLRENS